MGILVPRSGFGIFLLHQTFQSSVRPHMFRNVFFFSLSFICLSFFLLPDPPSQLSLFPEKVNQIRKLNLFIHCSELFTVFNEMKLSYIFLSILNVLFVIFVFLTGLLSDEFLWSRVVDPGWDWLDPDAIPKNRIWILSVKPRAYLKTVLNFALLS